MKRTPKLSTYMKLRAAIRRLAPQPGPVYLDATSGHAFIITRSPHTRVRVVSRVSATDVDTLTSDLNVGEWFGLLPVTTYAMGWGILRRSSSPAAFTQAPGEDEPQPVDLGPARTGPRDVWFESRAGNLRVSDGEALELAEQLGRAIPIETV